MLVIKEEKIAGFLKSLEKDYKVYDQRGSKLPAKKFFFPPTEETFYSEKKGVIKSPKLEGRFVVFGLKILQLEALTYLDEIMATPAKDFFYWQRRDNSVVIGMTDIETDALPGGDVVLQKSIDGSYKVLANSPKGEAFIRKYQKLFETTKEEPANSAGQLSDWSKEMRQILLDPETLADAVEWSWNHKIWDELATTCLGCGVCTYVCPLCHCFSTEDQIDLTGKCSRCRKWDACTLPGFAEIAGGHNFRPTIKERYYNWFYHKFVRAYKEYGKSQCVGCGKCKKYCPAKIDIQEILKTILEDYTKEKLKV